MCGGVVKCATGISGVRKFQYISRWIEKFCGKVRNVVAVGVVVMFWPMLWQ
jgi:hypothetical protein